MRVLYDVKNRTIKKRLDITTIEAVNGMWLSGWFGTLWGILMGMYIGTPLGIIGATVAVGCTSDWNCPANEPLNNRVIIVCAFGLICFFNGAIAGMLCGVAIGGLTGLPAGILAAGIGKERKDDRECRGRLGGALATLSIGATAVVARYGYAVKRHFTGQFEQERWFLPLLIALLLLFIGIGYLSGCFIDSKLAKGDKELVGFNAKVNAYGIQKLDHGQRFLCLATALLPIVLLYAFLTRLLLTV